LVRRKPSDGAARDAAAQLNGSKDLFHARDRSARKCFSVDLHFEGAVLRIADLDGRCVLARAAKEKFTKPIGFTGIVVSGAPWNPRFRPPLDPRHRRESEPQNLPRGENNPPGVGGAYLQTVGWKTVASELTEPFRPWQGK